MEVKCFVINLIFIEFVHLLYFYLEFPKMYNGIKKTYNELDACSDIFISYNEWNVQEISRLQLRCHEISISIFCMPYGLIKGALCTASSL